VNGDDRGRAVAVDALLEDRPVKIRVVEGADGMGSVGLGKLDLSDPLDNPSDLREGNRYLYVGDDPVNLVAPTGELSCSTLGIGHVCKAAQRAASSVVHHPLRTLYNAATGCLTYGEIGFFAGLSVGRPDVGAIAGCAGGAVIGQFAPTAPYEGGGIPLR
jgi:hypothetical protein